MEPRRQDTLRAYSSSITDKLTFSTETTSVLPASANFSVPSRQKYAATGNSSDELSFE